ncbi:TadE-like protein [Kribbella antiqua]|uniref:TadE-like protein n=1 Tax=Kribbella antiqua TaxID=2512217 RepID=A0A4V2S4B4_9ACTN|nr:TadE family type IV pilus minor pilin [Kribbella antiqua]TCO47600.1 TadE-like protein [Kribbella antiqua]
MQRKRLERGAVIAEVAIVLPVLLSVVFLGVWWIGIIMVNIQCIDAARDVARAAARGETPEAAREIGRRAAPDNATIEIRQSGPDIHVTVTATPHTNAPLLTALPAPTLKAEATLQTEPTQGGTP